MKHAVTLLIAVFSMTFLTGGSCDSGDFTTSYYCCGTDDGVNSTCSTSPKQCPASDCNTGLQTFQNGQNECAILQTDASNNTCALYARFAEYITIGCTGTFTENPPLAAPTIISATPGSQQVTLNWTAPPGISGPIVYTVLIGTATGAEGFLASGITTTTYQATSLTPGQPYFFTVAANLIFAGNIASPGVSSLEATATPTN